MHMSWKCIIIHTVSLKNSPTFFFITIMPTKCHTKSLAYAKWELLFCLKTKKSGMVIIFSLCVKNLQPVHAYTRNLNEGLPVYAQVWILITTNFNIIMSVIIWSAFQIVRFLIEKYKAMFCTINCQLTLEKWIKCCKN